MSKPAEQHGSHRRWLGLAFGALGVVYGDIGTSPLYAVKELFDPRHGVATTPANVVGIMSLILWALTLVVTVKYLVFVLRADNKGEGGILALLSLAFPERRDRPAAGMGTRVMVAVCLMGACLLYGDGIIIPAISVLGAVEGLGVATPALKPAILPATVVLLILLFAAQRVGTAKVGRVFGPITLVWFVVIAVLGVRGILRAPAILAAFNPLAGLAFLGTHPGLSAGVLGAVVLVVTGGEALYADMGHFGPRPIRLAWFAV
ncbi:MAG: KUP/HAK/KT family potassium transporter, partial [Verrucomicrobiota bacterium]